MRGDLAETPAVDVCRSLAAARADGVLTIHGPDGRGVLVWRAGTVIAATSPTPPARLGDRLVGAGLLEAAALRRLETEDPVGDPQRLAAVLLEQGLVERDAIRSVFQEQVIDAVFDVFGWGYGAYRFDPLDPGAAGSAVGGVVALTSPLPFDQLVTEIARRQSGWRELARDIPDLDAVVTVPAEAPARTVLGRDAHTVLTAALATATTGHRSVRHLADDLGYGRFETARIVHGLVQLGHLEVAPPEDEIGRALDEAMSLLAPPAPDTDEPAAEVLEEDPRHEPRAAAVEEDPPHEPPAAALEADTEPDTEAEPVTDVEQDPAADAPPRVPRPPAEVSEFLRELSQLALEDDGAAAPPSPPPRRAGPTDEPQEPRPKRRLFGRG
jgi:hypothetical protein